MKLPLKILNVCMLIVMTACSNHKRVDDSFAPMMPQPVRPMIYNNASIYHPGTAWLLHEDMKAHRIGDMLTVTLQEKTDAEKSAETGVSKATSASIIDPTILGGALTAHGRAILDNSINSDSSFDGSGDSSQSNSLTGSITVTVVEVLSNGNLIVQGE